MGMMMKAHRLIMSLTVASVCLTAGGNVLADDKRTAFDTFSLSLSYVTNTNTNEFHEFWTSTRAIGPPPFN